MSHTHDEDRAQSAAQSPAQSAGPITAQGPAQSPAQDPAEMSAAECADYLEQIVYLIDNELDEADCSAVRAHLESCTPCLAKYDLQRTVKQVVARSCSETAPGGLRARILVQLEQVRVQISEG